MSEELYPRKSFSDLEIKKLEEFCNDGVMKEAVKKILLSVLYSHGTLKAGEEADPTKNFALVYASQSRGIDDAIVGHHVKTMWEAINLVESAFRNISTYKKESVDETKSHKTNPR